MEVPREDIRENRKVGDTKGSTVFAARSDRSHQNVDGESPTSTRKTQESEENGEVGGVWIVGKAEELEQEEETSEYHSHTHREVEEGTGRPGYQSKYWTSEDRRDQYETREAVRREFSKIHGDQRDG